MGWVGLGGVGEERGGERRGGVGRWVGLVYCRVGYDTFGPTVNAFRSVVSKI